MKSEINCPDCGENNIRRKDEFGELCEYQEELGTMKGFLCYCENCKSFFEERNFEFTPFAQNVLL